jgi:predicted transglutaminase-like cysteine proteinase
MTGLISECAFPGTAEAFEEHILDEYKSLARGSVRFAGPSSTAEPPQGRRAKMRIAVCVMVTAIIVGFALPSPANERPSDPFGNHTIELHDEVGFVSVWKFLRDVVLLDKRHFHNCLESSDTICPSLPTFMKIIDEARENKGKALLGHLNRSINSLIKPAPSQWMGPLEAITMRSGDCKAYSIAKYAAVRAVGISPDFVRLVIVHNQRRSEDHMVVAVYQEGEWFILDNLTNPLLQDSEVRGYEPLVVLDYEGARQYPTFWMQ